MQLKNLIKKLCHAKSSGEVSGATGISKENAPFDFGNATGALRYHMTNDLLVKLLLERNENVLKSLISSLLHISIDSITELEITNPFILGKYVDSKSTILDIHLVINKNTSIDIEMQVVKEPYWKNRSILYLGRQYDRIKVGDDYDKLIPAIHIGILDFDLFPNEEPEFFATYKLMNIKNYNLYSDKLQINVLNLNQINYATDEDKAYGIDHWAKLFKATTWEDLKMLAEKDPIFKEASETIYKLTEEDYLRSYLRSREIYELDELTKKNQAKKLQEEYQALVAKKNELTSKNKTLASENKMLTSENQTLSSENQTLSSENQTLSSENQTLSSENVALQAELAAYKAKYGELN